jgi:hypothetical protein
MGARHPANRGKVMMVLWVEPVTRDMARVRAEEAGQPVSEWGERAIERASAEQTVARAIARAREVQAYNETRKP